MRRRVSKKEREPIRKVGDVFVVEFVTNIKNPKRKPVCRINGKVGFISTTYRGEFVEPLSLWLIEVLEIKNNHMVVEPVDCIENAEQHDYTIKKKLEDLQRKQSEKTKYKKPTKNYPYLSKQERRNIHE